MEKFTILEPIVPDIPATRIILLSDFETPIAQWLNTLIQQREASLDIKILRKDKVKTLETSLRDKSEFLHVEFLAKESMRYDNRGYKYDTLFLHVETEIEERMHLLERIYASMKNGGGVVIVVDKKLTMWNNIEEELDMCNFVAINPIELDQECIVYYAKKMHGWGGAR